MSQFGDKVAKDTEPEARGAVDEINAAGKHIKKSANLAGQAAQDAYQNVASSAKKETGELASEVDKFRQQHHLKEGDHTPEDVLSNKYNQAADKVSSKATELKQDANEAAFNAADKFKNAKSSAAKTSEQNPMVNEKVSSDKTKSSYERGLESHANDNVRDTSNLVGKDTDKVKKVWDDKNSQEKSSGEATNENESKGFWSGLLGSGGASNEAAPPKTTRNTPSTPHNQPEKKVYDSAPTNHGNPMVYEKHNFDKTKPGWETRLEGYAQSNVHDTSTLVGKDTEKVRGVWNEKHVRDNGGHPIAEENSESFWSSLFGQAKEVENKVEERLEEGWEDVKSKVGLSTNDVKQDASEAYQDAKGKASAEANRLKRSASSTVDDLSNKAEHESSRLESKWNNIKSQAKDDAQSAYDSATDAASNVSNKLKRETSKATSETQSKAEQLKRSASDRFETEKNRASSNLKNLHDEVSSNAEQWKNESEKTAKSWYQKGTDQIKNGLETVKTTADKDLHWAEEKVSEGLSTAKGEVDRLLGKEQPKNTSYTDHVTRGEKFAEEEEGLLTHTRTNTKLKPAEIIVENSDGKDM